MDPNGMTPISHRDSFCFCCSREVPCFNDCCRDLNQFLTPYDILRLKRSLNVTSAVFLERFIVCRTGPESGLPVVSFKSDAATGHACPFVSRNGCRVYADRPTSCRLYPLARAISRSRESGAITEHFALLKEPHCQGHRRPQKQTVETWVVDQGLSVYNTYNDMMMALIHLKNRRSPGALGAEDRRRFRLALYDLDAFRETAFSAGFFRTISTSVRQRTYEAARHEDTALLEVGIAWLGQTLFGA